MINGVNLNLDSQDRRLWLGENQGIYTVKCRYAYLHSSNTMISSIYFGIF